MIDSIMADAAAIASVRRDIHAYPELAPLLPYSPAFLVSGLLLTMAWVWLHAPAGPGAPVGFVLPQ